MVFVRDQDRSLCFYRDLLGFTVMADATLQNGERFALVAPPDGSVGLTLAAPPPGSPFFDRIGQSTPTVFVTDDIDAQYREWQLRGVPVHRALNRENWGVASASFKDLDGNVFVLAGWDAITREIEERRRATAERAELKRRAVIELALASEVQSRLFPQLKPSLANLEYAGRCIQARAVGGDYYDFLNLGQRRLGLVVGDVSGKGTAAALMMSNLQANLRSQTAVAHDGLDQALGIVSAQFYANTPDASYATLFFGLYDDETGSLTYVNCGHLPALLVRHTGSIERLASTAPVLGLFPKWACEVVTCRLESGDALVMYTDGVTEAFDVAGEEFGETRLIQVVEENREHSPGEMVDAIIAALRGFSGEEQSDDITLVVARRGAN
jgi:serine phosphatase RsbU (regulator of sigma subunit)/predicted enzyme related to lactoylglutathione lyase